MKKLNLSIVFFFLMILFLGFASAQSCSIKTRGSCTDNIIMGLSGSTNAHGELWDQENYDSVLCCDFGAGDRECSSHLHPEYGENASANKIIGLSSVTNAHAEIPGESNFETEVCYEKLVCISNANSCSAGYSIKMLSLSDYTNAHIGGFDDYDTKICCEQIECRVDVLFCRDYDERECNYEPCNVADESVHKNNPGITCGEGYICNCMWDDSESTCGPRWQAIRHCGDNEIDSGEECDGTDWGLITGCDNSGDTGLDDYTGGTLSCKTDCTFDVSRCTGGVTGGFCGDNEINNVYETCDNNSLSEKTCADFGLCEDGGLACYPPEHSNNCTFNTTGCVSCESHPGTGICFYHESTDDNCDDKFLTYSFVASIKWPIGNEGWVDKVTCENNVGEGNCVQFNRTNEVNDDGKWHYDPNRKSYNGCISGGTIVPCPAQIQLPFFGPYSVITILALIVLIYIFLTRKKKGKKSKFFMLFSKE